MTAAVPLNQAIPILSVAIEREMDVVTARRRARQIAETLGFVRQDQVRIATAVSEIARNAYRYGKRGRVEFLVSIQDRPQTLWIQVRDNGPGIPDIPAVLSGELESSTGMGIGLTGTRRLMDEFEISSRVGEGTTVLLGKKLPPGRVLDRSGISRLSTSLTQQSAEGSEELERQNRDLLLTLDALRARESELERRKEELARLNLELEETNRGVLALYAELDEKAVALSKADEMKSRFLRHVSHEFRTPVNSVLALSRLLLQRTDGVLTAEQEKQVNYIRQAVEQLAEMVNDLLDLAKVESGKTEIHSTQIDIAQFLGAIRALMKPLVTNPDVTLIFEDALPGLDLYSDEGKLGQIVRNLISNALKFTPRGEVRVFTELTPDERTFRLKVQDTGIGIDSKDHDRIFQEFAQVDGPLQRTLKGTGLGLPLSRKLAGLLGGALEVESQPGQGSTFTLTIPRLIATNVAPDNRVIAQPELSSTVLVVDDDATARYLIRQLFRGTRYNVAEANGSEAAERARFEKPALVVLDLVMPDRSGFAVLEELRSHDSTRDVPVIIHTSKSLSRTDLAMLEGKHSGILPKGARNRVAGLEAIRKILHDDTLFTGEPEFQESLS